MKRPAHAAAVLFSAMLTVGAAAAGCGSSAKSTSAPAPPVVVPGPAGAYRDINVSAGRREVTLIGAQIGPLVPLVAARSFVPTEPLASYGLDPPAARLTYDRSSGAPLTLLVGSAGFDAHFVYVMDPVGRLVYTVASDQLRAVLAQVGVTVPQPTS